MSTPESGSPTPRSHSHVPVNPGAGLDASQEIILLEDVQEEPPPPRAMPKPRSMSRPQPGVPTKIGSYFISQVFAAGMVDGVYLGHKISQHGLVTQAVLKWARRARPNFDAKREVLLDEARALSVIHHPNVVRLLDTDEDDYGFFIAVEYVPGSDLRAVMAELAQRDLRLPAALACFVCVNILRGLDHAHRATDENGLPLDIIHRDVTPSNILMSVDGHLKLTDFGVVRMRDRQQPQTLPGLVKGKFRYMAPEYVEGGAPSIRSDIYAVGVTLFELLTGRYAFNEQGRRNIFKTIMEQGLDLSPLRAAEIPAPLVEIVAQATHRDPAQRFAFGGAMADSLETWLARDGAYVSPSTLAMLLRMLGLNTVSNKKT